MNQLFPTTREWSALLDTGQPISYPALEKLIAPKGRQLVGEIYAGRLSRICCARGNDGKYYAVKVYTLSKRDANALAIAQNLKNEFAMLRRLKERSVEHVLYPTDFSVSESGLERIIGDLRSGGGYIAGGSALYLVYVTMPLGLPLGNWFKTPNWAQRLRSASRCDMIDFIFQLFNSLSSLHGQKILHRDIKPDNIVLIVKNGRVEINLIDFNISRPLDHTSLNFTYMKNTPLFASPEALGNTFAKCGFEDGARMDVYSMALIAYMLLNDGLLPFQRTAAMKDYSEILDNRRRGVPVPPPQKSPDSRLTRLILRCLSHENRNRPDLQSILSELNRMRNPHDSARAPRRNNEADTVVYGRSSGKSVSRYAAPNNPYRRNGGSAPSYKPKKYAASPSYNPRPKAGGAPNIKSYNGFGSRKR